MVSKIKRFVLGTPTLLALVYGFIAIMGPYFFLLFISGKVEAFGVNNLSKVIKQKKRGVILAPNHPSLMETLLVYILIVPFIIFHPVRLSAWSTPAEEFFRRFIFGDSKNKIIGFILFLLKKRLIIVERSPSGNEKGANFRLLKSKAKALRRAKTILKLGQMVIIFFEQGRTLSGKDFVYSVSKKNKIRVINNSLGNLVIESGAYILPIWINIVGDSEKNACNMNQVYLKFWGQKIVFSIGKAICADDFPPEARKNKKAWAEEITKAYTNSMLELADEFDKRHWK